MRTIYLLLFVLLSVMHINSMEKELCNKKDRLLHVLDIKELSGQKLSPRSEKAPQKKYSIVNNKKNRNLLLNLPNDILRKVIYHASKDNIFNAVTLLIRLSRVCKLLTSLHEPNNMKTILDLDQRILDDNLIIYATEHLAPEQDFTPFLKILIAMDAKVNYPNNLISCVKNATNTYFVEHYITHYESNINTQDDMGNTPLQYAISLNKPTIMKVLLEHGADINLKNNLGDAPTRIALLHGYTECIKLLIQYKIDTSIEYDYSRDDTITIAQWAENAKNEEIYKLATGKELPKKWYEYLAGSFKR